MPPTTDHIPFIGAVKDEWVMFSDNFTDYDIGLPIGFGASSIVYAATYKPRDGSPHIPCALKVVDLDKLPQSSLRLLRRETQLMSLSKHPNVLRVRGSWMDGHKLYIALRLMNSGSAADVMHYGWPGGMEEEVVKCILKQALEGLNYLHVNGFIHRDIKAANLLIDDDGTVLLGDLGVAASLCDEEAVGTSSSPRTAANVVGGADRPRPPQSSSHHRIGKRKSFVGTPCWMAPELILGKQYDAKADIWSFGITAIELCQGRAPRSREAPSKVLMKTVQDAPPTFDRQGGQYKYSKAFKEIVESCLVKDPAKRPTAAQLLETPFFKSAKKKSYLVGAILKDLPPLTKRQERRRQPSARSSLVAYDSWDFTSTALSPSTSVFPRTNSYTKSHASVSVLPADGRRSHALNRFDASVREGVAAVRELRREEYEDNGDESTASSSAMDASPSASSSSSPTTPEIGTVPLPSTGDDKAQYTGKLGFGGAAQVRRDGEMGIRKLEGLQLGGLGGNAASTVKPAIRGGAEARNAARPSTSDGLRSAFGRQSKPIGVRSPSSANTNTSSNTGSGTIKQSAWKKFIKGMSGEELNSSNSKDLNTAGLPSSFSSTSSSVSGGVGANEPDGTLKKKKRQSSFVGRMLERTVSNTDAGRRGGIGTK